MVNNNRIVLKNDLKGPANRPLLRLSRFGGGGVFFVPGNQLGYSTAIHPKTGATQSFLTQLQGAFQRKEGVAVVAPLTGQSVKGQSGGKDGLGWWLRKNAYQEPTAPATVRWGYRANRQGGRCPTCGR